MQSECVADDGSHTIYNFNLNAGWQSATAYAITSVYDPLPQITALWTTGSDDDVYAYNANYGLTGIWAWTQCVSGATYGGTDPSRWCKPQWLDYNTSYAQTASQAQAISCHEMGHTLGLQHSNESSGSCMIKNQRTINILSAHDKSMIAGHY